MQNFPPEFCHRSSIRRMEHLLKFETECQGVDTPVGEMLIIQVERHIYAPANGEYVRYVEEGTRFLCVELKEGEQVELATYNELMSAAQSELDTLNEQELEKFAIGWDNRMLDCVTERWSLPERLRDGAISKLAQQVRDFEEMLRSKAGEVEL